MNESENLQELENQLQENPNDLKLNKDLARLYLKSKETEKSMSLWRKCLELDPCDHEAHFQLGRHLCTKELFQEGAGHLFEACRLNPESKGYRNELRSHLDFIENTCSEYQLPFSSKNRKVEIRNLQTSAVTAIAEILRARKAKKFFYVHADHFEPWVSARELEKKVDLIKQFADITANSEYAGKQSLFYKVETPYVFREDIQGRAFEGLEGDRVVFVDRSEKERNIDREAMSYLVEKTQHEIQIHIHHENLTRSKVCSTAEGKWIAANSNMEMDVKRFDLLVKRALSAARLDTGLKLESWAFVHGCWALNASDLDVCCLENEIEILMSHGCWGDFSFPAGRGHCDPKIKEPLSVLPRSGKKVYDLEISDPRPVMGSGLQPGSERFFIWNQPLAHPWCSIDYYSRKGQVMLSDPATVAKKWASGAINVGGHLYFKTHAHSLYPTYRHEKSISFPHFYPPVQKIFSLLTQACEKAGVEFKPLTAEESLHAMRKETGFLRKLERKFLV